MQIVARENHPAAEDARGSRFEILSHFLCVEADRGFLVEFERDGAAGVEIILIEVTQEEIPFIDTPQLFGLVSVEADLVGGDDVEPTVENRQILEGLDSKAGSGYPEQRNHIAVEFIVRQVDTLNVVAEIFAAIQEVAGATSQIHHRGLR